MKEKNTLSISILQYDVAWHDVDKNLSLVEEKLKDLPPTDIVVLPETFTTGFSIEAIEFAEDINGKTVNTIKRLAQEHNAAFAGSFVAKEDDKYYNRGFFILPTGEAYFYDKRHLFLFGEDRVFTRGDKHLIVDYKGWNIFMSVCYDLRFPVWLKNTDYKYDVLINVAQWPETRQFTFENLSIARAIENQTFTVACNRVGKDGNRLNYVGGSQIVDFNGKVLASLEYSEEGIISYTIEKRGLDKVRRHFPINISSDKFTIELD